MTSCDGGGSREGGAACEVVGKPTVERLVPRPAPTTTAGEEDVVLLLLFDREKSDLAQGAAENIREMSKLRAEK